MSKLHVKHRFTRSFIAFLLIFSLLASGCYGSFALTKKLYEFNGAVQDRFVRSIVTAAMIIFPVYWFGGVVDWVLFNTIEFWTGKNPMTEEIIKAPARGKKSSLGEDLYVLTLRRVDSGVESKIDAYQEGTLVRSLILHFEESSSVVAADLLWAKTGVSEHYTARQLPDGRVLVIRENSSGEKTASLIESAEVQKVTARLVTYLSDKTAPKMFAKAGSR